MNYNDVLTKAWSVVHCWRGLRPGQIGLHVIELEAALKAADPQELTDLRQENEALRAKWAEMLPKLEVLRHYLFRVDRKLASLSEMVEEPGEIVDLTSAFLSVLELYFPSPEEEALAEKELTRIEALGQELERDGGNLREEVKREFASIKAQIDTEISRLESETKRLREREASLVSELAEVMRARGGVAV